jgi:cytochrome c peroxidase
VVRAIKPQLALIILLPCLVIAADTWSWNLPKGFPRPRVPADNPMTAAKVELGRYLFYDTRLSVNGKS